MDITPVIQPFGPGTEDGRITDMNGRHLAAAVDHYRLDHPWGAFLHATYRKFLAAGGRPGDRVATLVELSPRVVLGFLRGEP
jgi:hypothetical protein